MAKKLVDLNQEVIENRAKIDCLVEEVKETEANIAEFEALYKKRLEDLEKQYQERILTLTDRKEKLLGEINAWFEFAEPKETKTQYKLSVLAGDVVRKKASLKYEPDKAQLLEWAKENDKALVKTTVKEDVDWMQLKGRLVMQQDLEGNTVALDTESGEIIPGVAVVEVAAKLEVK